MWIRTTCLSLGVVGMLGVSGATTPPAGAQTPLLVGRSQDSAVGAPLSAIPWLDRQSPTPAGPTILLEPSVTPGTAPDVSVRPLPEQAAPVGLVSAEQSGIAATVFQNSDARTLARLIARAPVIDSPALQSVLYSLLLAETVPPAGAEPAAALMRARLDRLLQLGAADPAQALAEMAGGAQDPQLFRRWFDAALLTGDEARACASLNARPALAPSLQARIFCAARGGDWQTAELLRANGATLGLLSVAENELLDRFLNTEFYEDAPFLPVPAQPDALTFRLYESIGERLPTASLPRVFANADLRDVAGWKAQLEAAERLTRSGAMVGNHLLGIYTARRPAASGGVWDRVRAVQALETALQGQDPAALDQALIAAWAAMEQARIETAFAGIFADALRGRDLTSPQARQIAFRVQLLAGKPGAALVARPDTRAETRFLLALAGGRPDVDSAPDPQAAAIAAGFADPAPLPRTLDLLLGADRQGEVMLRAITRFDQGADGNLAALTEAIATLRATGLERTARRAALELRLLKRS
ncbi:MAG: hypothetical protein OIF47_12715 [Marinibacterium sp.]|nr:hypothetical protein [Marinibacterium sp.]